MATFWISFITLFAGGAVSVLIASSISPQCCCQQTVGWLLLLLHCSGGLPARHSPTAASDKDFILPSIPLSLCPALQKHLTVWHHHHPLLVLPQTALLFSLSFWKGQSCLEPTVYFTAIRTWRHTKQAAKKMTELPSLWVSIYVKLGQRENLIAHSWNNVP